MRPIPDPAGSSKHRRIIDLLARREQVYANPSAIYRAPFSARHRQLMPFARADRDGDGAITREEMLARVDSAARERAQTRRERAIGRFDAMDTSAS